MEEKKKNDTSRYGACPSADVGCYLEYIQALFSLLRLLLLFLFSSVNAI